MLAGQLITKLELSIAAVALTLAASDSSGQTRSTPGSTKPPDPQAEIVRLLQSNEERERAWGAWLAGRDNLRHLIPEVRRVVIENSARGGIGLGTTAALDALIQMKANVTSDFLSNVNPDYPAQALILASHSAEEADAFLLDVVTQAKDLPWYAAANLLLTRGKARPALGEAILRNLKLAVTVYLVRSGGLRGGSGGGLGIGCGFTGMAPGFPPLAAYKLTPFATPGEVVLADGPKPVYCARTLSEAGLTPAGSFLEIGGPTADDRVTYLARLAGRPPEDLPVRGAESHSIQLDAGVDPTTEVERIRADVQRRMSLLIAELVRLGALTESAARIQPPVDITIEDLRGEKN